VRITGLSVLTAEIPLVLYTLVDPAAQRRGPEFDFGVRDVREAADGMGFRPGTRLLARRAALAVPLIVAGLRVASVSTIGLVSITAVLAMRSAAFGFFIYEGMTRFFATEIFAGAIPTIALALAADRFFLWVQRRVTPWTRPARPLEGTAT